MDRDAERRVLEHLQEVERLAEVSPRVRAALRRVLERWQERESAITPVSPPIKFELDPTAGVGIAFEQRDPRVPPSSYYPTYIPTQEVKERLREICDGACLVIQLPVKSRVIEEQGIPSIVNLPPAGVRIVPEPVRARAAASPQMISASQPCAMAEDSANAWSWYLSQPPLVRMIALGLLSGETFAEICAELSTKRLKLSASFAQPRTPEAEVVGAVVATSPPTATQLAEPVIEPGMGLSLRTDAGNVDAADRADGRVFIDSALRPDSDDADGTGWLHALVVARTAFRRAAGTFRARVLAFLQALLAALQRPPGDMPFREMYWFLTPSGEGVPRRLGRLPPEDVDMAFRSEERAVRIAAGASALIGQPQVELGADVVQHAGVLLEELSYLADRDLAEMLVELESAIRMERTLSWHACLAMVNARARYHHYLDVGEKPPEWHALYWLHCELPEGVRLLYTVDEQPLSVRCRELFEARDLEGRVRFFATLVRYAFQKRASMRAINRQDVVHLLDQREQELWGLLHGKPGRVRGAV